MLSTALEFSKVKVVIVDYFILAQEALGYSQEFLPPWAQLKYWTNGEIKFH